MTTEKFDPSRLPAPDKVRFFDGTVTPTGIDITYEEAISKDRYQVVQRGFWWRIKIGDGTATYGKFYSRNAANDIVGIIRREFLNGAFVARSQEAQLSFPGRLIADGTRTQVPTVED